MRSRSAPGGRHSAHRPGTAGDPRDPRARASRWRRGGASRGAREEPERRLHRQSLQPSGQCVHRGPPCRRPIRPGSFLPSGGMSTLFIIRCPETFNPRPWPRSPPATDRALAAATPMPSTPSLRRLSARDGTGRRSPSRDGSFLSGSGGRPRLIVPRSRRTGSIPIPEIADHAEPGPCGGKCWFDSPLGPGRVRIQPNGKLAQNRVAWL